MKDMPKISSFRGTNFFLSNFYEAPVVYGGITYKNNEAAFQAQKVMDDGIRREFSELSPSDAKKRGRRVSLRGDWKKVKYDIMYGIVEAKFRQNPELKRLLLATGNARLEEGNNWGDTTWGTVNGVRNNKLGIILMQVRSVLWNEENRPGF